MTPLALLQLVAPFLPTLAASAPSGDARAAATITAHGLQRIAAHPDPASIARAAEDWAQGMLPLVEPHLPPAVQSAVALTRTLLAVLDPPQPVAVVDDTAGAPVPVP